ncbi:hypothetical protein VTJ04DRAFT_10162 [Mycothermus thermophilus]|uniref:uncharacterized protein n=1 Tax=Humicola insolens TaxID=85995 RepID=UPI00374262AD
MGTFGGCGPDGAVPFPPPRSEDEWGSRRLGESYNLVVVCVVVVMASPCGLSSKFCEVRPIRTAFYSAVPDYQARPLAQAWLVRIRSASPSEIQPHSNQASSPPAGPPFFGAAVGQISFKRQAENGVQELTAEILETPQTHARRFAAAHPIPHVAKKASSID